MARRRTRRFTLLDASILIAAIAAGLAIPRTFAAFHGVSRNITVYRTVGPGNTSGRGASKPDRLEYPYPGVRAARPAEGLFLARHLAFWPGLILAPLTVATFVLGTFGMDRPRKQHARRAGSIAGLAFLMAAAATAVRVPMLLGVRDLWRTGLSGLHWGDWWMECLFTLPRMAGFAVVVAWAALAFGRLWSVGKDWPDRLGVALGAGWVGMASVDLAAGWALASMS